MVVYTLERFTKCTCDRLTEDADLEKKKKIIFSNEAHFDFGGYVNKQKCRIWGTRKRELLFGALFCALFLKIHYQVQN